MPKTFALVPLTLLAATAAQARTVEILVVGDSKPYVAAARAAAAGIGEGTEPTVIPVDTPLPASWHLESPRVVVAVGARAVRLALTLPDAKIVAAMVLQESPELANERVHTVPLAVPVDRQLQLLARLAPAARTVGLVVDPRHSAAVITEARAAATKLGKELVLREVQDDAKVVSTFAALLPTVDAVLLIADTTIVKREVLELLVESSLALQVPIIGYSGAVVQAGLVAGYGVEPNENGRAAAIVAAALAAGRAPKPVQLTGQLHINLKSARAIGVTVPPDLAAPPTIIYQPR